MTAFDNANDRLIDLAAEVVGLAAEHARVTKLDADELAKRRLRIERVALASSPEARTHRLDASQFPGHGRPRQLSAQQQGGKSVATIEKPIAAGRLLERGSSIGVALSDRGRRIVANERFTLAKDLVKRYLSGESIRALAASTGRSYGFVHRVLTESGVKLRQRGGARRRKKA
jgi:hypothetical protein